MQEFTWDAVRLPGIRKASKIGPFRFNVRPASGVARASFDCHVELSKSDLLCFDLHSPTSSAMYPDIVRGDFGFPIVCIKNRAGTVYRFARGNLKDFFDISRPNERQRIKLPINAFVYDRDLTTNVPDEGSFFDSPVVNIYFDFLAHPVNLIDIELGHISIEPSKNDGWEVQSLIIFERTGQAKQLPPFSTESSSLSFSVSLSGVGAARDLQGAILTLCVWRGESRIQEISVQLNNENAYLTIALPHVGSYRLDAAIVKNDEKIAASSWTICRVLSARGGDETILGVSDEYEYDRIAALGGSWDRMPVSLQGTVRNPDRSIRFSAGADPFPRTVPIAGRFRIIAPFAMPKWLSRVQAPDYYRYAPTDFEEYSHLVGWMIRRSREAGATHYEVWNEASAMGHWNENMESLIELHRITYEVAKSVAPEITVLGGCTHSWKFDFLHNFLKAGGARYCDGLAIHGYTYQPKDYLEQFDQLEDLLLEFAPGRRDFKTYITEIGFRYPAFSLEDQAKFLTLYTLEGASRKTVGAMLWFRYTNPRPEILSGYRQNSSTGYAMVGHNGSYCRPSFAAYRFVQRLLQQFDEVRASGPSTARRYEFIKDGSVEAVGLYQPEGEPDLPPDWRVLDQYGAPLEGHADLRVAVSPRSAHLLA